MKNSSKKLNDLILKHRKLIERKNKVDENWYNGIYERYVNPIQRIKVLKISANLLI